MAKRKFLSAQERYDLVMECRKSGLSDSAWCKQKGIPQSTFYHWVEALRARGISEIDSVRSEIIVSNVQEVVKLDIVSEEKKPILPTVPDNSESIYDEVASAGIDHQTIEISVKGTTIKFSNDVRPELMKVTLQFLGGTLC